MVGLRGTDEVICLIYKQVTSVVKELNVKRHCQTSQKSYDNFVTFPVWPSIICWLPELALSHLNFEDLCLV